MIRFCEDRVAATATDSVSYSLVLLSCRCERLEESSKYGGLILGYNKKIDYSHNTISMLPSETQPGSLDTSIRRNTHIF